MSLDHFKSKFKITGIDESADPNFIEDLKEIFTERTHILESSIKKTENAFIVEIELESLDSRLATKQAHEELYEILSAILNHIDGVRITSLN